MKEQSSFWLLLIICVFFISSFPLISAQSATLASSSNVVSDMVSAKGARLRFTLNPTHSDQSKLTKLTIQYVVSGPFTADSTVTSSTGPVTYDGQANTSPNLRIDLSSSTDKLKRSYYFDQTLSAATQYQVRLYYVYDGNSFYSNLLTFSTEALDTDNTLSTLYATNGCGYLQKGTPITTKALSCQIVGEASTVDFTLYPNFPFPSEISAVDGAGNALSITRSTTNTALTLAPYTPFWTFTSQTLNSGSNIVSITIKSQSGSAAVFTITLSKPAISTGVFLSAPASDQFILATSSSTPKTMKFGAFLNDGETISSANQWSFYSDNQNYLPDSNLAFATTSPFTDVTLTVTPYLAYSDSCITVTATVILDSGKAASTSVCIKVFKDTSSAVPAGAVSSWPAWQNLYDIPQPIEPTLRYSGTDSINLLPS